MIVDTDFLTLRTKKLHKKVELNFLLLCRQHSVYPAFITNSVSRHKRGYFYNQSVKRAMDTLLRAAIKDTRSALAKCDLALYKLHHELAQVLHPLVYDRMDVISHDVAYNRMISKLDVLKKKLKSLLHNKVLSRANSVETTVLPKCPYDYDFKDNNDTNVLLPLNAGTGSSNKELLVLPPSHPLPERSKTIDTRGFVNLSTVDFNENQIEVLCYNLNFSLTPKAIPMIDLIAHLDTYVNRLIPNKDKELMKARMRTIIEAFELRENKDHAKIKLCCKEIKDKNIYILKADKGGQVVAVDKEDYEAKTNKILSDVETYRMVAKNPLVKLVSTLKEIIKNCKSLDKFTRERLVPSNHSLPYFYATPKLHKAETPYRPIVANCGSIYNFVSKFVTEQIRFLAASNVHSLSSASEFITHLRNMTFQPGDILLSIDIVSLYTNVPTKEAIDCLREQLETHGASTMSEQLRGDLIKLAQFCVSEPFFKHREAIYQQTTGLAMGSSLSSPLAEIFLHKIDQQITEYVDKPAHYFRYVDDGFVHWTHGPQRLECFLKHINTIHPSIKFTWELEKENVLPYLDILITRHESSITTSVYRKPYASSYPPHAFSNHPWSQKMTAFKAYTDRAYRYCDVAIDLNEELSHIEQVAIARGYSTDIVKRAARKSRNQLCMTETTTLTSQRSRSDKYAIIPFVPRLSVQLGKCFSKYGLATAYTHPMKLHGLLTTHKDKIRAEDSSGIYRIKCSCGKAYIGQTRRKFCTRKNEHYLASISDNPQRIETSSVATHVHLHNSHKINWEDAKVIQKCKSQFFNIHETIAVYQQRDQIINGKKDLKLNHNWKSLVDTL